jgi:hypothetical protein
MLKNFYLIPKKIFKYFNRTKKYLRYLPIPIFSYTYIKTKHRIIFFFFRKQFKSKLRNFNLPRIINY